MSSAELKLNLHQLIDKIQDNKTLSVIYSLFSNSFNVKSSSLSQAEKSAADEGIKSIEKGNFHKHDDVIAEMKKKYPDLH
ncbi:MAG: hypothetical protein HYU69_09550 [Bacteroidetes bacterium]|nr:hypothetical protein [Bacteroidota bacterium]